MEVTPLKSTEVSLVIPFRNLKSVASSVPVTVMLVQAVFSAAVTRVDNVPGVATAMVEADSSLTTGYANHCAAALYKVVVAASATQIITLAADKPENTVAPNVIADGVLRCA